MKKTIYFASSNKHKLKEIKKILSLNGVKNIVLKSAPEGFSVNENGKTYLSNAYKKASTLSKRLGVIAFADDSGFEVEALGKKPGIKSARFFKDGKGMLEILKKMRGKKNRKCSFVCAIVVTNEKGKIIFKCQKRWYGRVAEEMSGVKGFGYDPIFFLANIGKTAAEIKDKNKISHRAQAISSLASYLY